MVKADLKNISRRPLVVFGFTVLTPMIFAAPTQAADYDAGSIHITGHGLGQRQRVHRQALLR